MKRSKEMLMPIVIGLSVVIMFSFWILLIWWIIPTLTITPRERMQNQLAKELGVKIQDYPYPSSFPSGYFYTVLKPGMSISEVHEIVQGYEKVVQCDNLSEVYYYFSQKLEDAKRFELVYDDRGKYVRFEGEEDDSRTLQTFGCEPGLIQE